MSISVLLKRVHLFRNLNQEELDEIATICRPVSLEAGELLIEQNTTGKEMYIIADGSVDVFIRGTDDERGLVLLGKGQVVGEMALIDQGFRSASVRATSEGASLYRIDGDAFLTLCHEETRIGFIVMRNLAVDVAFKLRHQNLMEQ